MREIAAEKITEAIRKMCIEASCDLPLDVEKLIVEAAEREISPFGQYSLQKIVKNIGIARENTVPMCQDTGMTLVFAEIGQDVHITGGLLDDAVNEGVRQGYQDGYLRKSMVKDPLWERVNTNDNTPAVLYTTLVAGDQLKLVVMPKGAGSENMGGIKMLKPADGLAGVKQFVVDTVCRAGGNPCPPVIVGVGIGGSMEKAALLSKVALRREAGQPNSDARYAQLEKELLAEINRLGIGPQGFGGRVTALAVHIETYPTHIATLPVAVTLNCHAARHKERVL